VGWHPERLRVQLAFGAVVGASAQAALPASPESRYALREIKARGGHQASFRDAVLSAYRGRCAISHLPEPRLLDAAHIIMDADEQLGQPIVSNGLLLTNSIMRRSPATSRRENKKALIQNEISDLPIKSL
jgi:putative restriction endonuclease